MRWRWTLKSLGAGGWLALSLLTSAAAQSYQPPIVLSQMNNIFAFGDSYTATGYDPKNGLLNNLTTLGNSSANGFNWIQYLALRNPSTNNSYFDLAAFGATVNGSIIKDTNHTIPDFVQQVATFQKYFVPPPPAVNWTSDDTLFALWFGINDIGFSFIYNVTFPTIFPAIGASYNTLVQRLYLSGARNFLILGVPPTDRSPLINELGPGAVAQVKQNIASYNTLLGMYPAAFAQAYPDAKLVLFDTQPVFNEIINNPAPYGFTDVNTTCLAYENVLDNPLVDLPELCPWPFMSYVWANGYHPTWRVHEILGDVVRKRLTPTLVIDSNLTALPLSTAPFTSPRSIATPSSSPTSAPTAASTGGDQMTTSRNMQSVISVIAGPRATSGASSLAMGTLGGWTALLGVAWMM